MKPISLSVFRAGTVWVNCYDVLEAQAPFGGYKVKTIFNFLIDVYGVTEKKCER